MDSSTLLEKRAEKVPAPGGPALPRDFAGLYEEHSRSIYYIALRLLGDPGLAEDATHDIFMKVFRKIDQFRGESCIRTWLYRITLNHCHNLVKSWYHRNIRPADDEMLSQTPSNSGEHPLQVLETKELGQRIQKSLDALPEEYRLLLLLVADERLSYHAIASLTEQSEDAVRGKLHRARKAFTASFKQTA